MATFGKRTTLERPTSSFFRPPGGKTEEDPLTELLKRYPAGGLVSPLAPRGPRKWEDIQRRMPPLYRDPSIGQTGIDALTKELSDPYRGIGGEAKAGLDANAAFALAQGGQQAAGLASLGPGRAAVQRVPGDPGGQSFTRRRGEMPARGSGAGSGMPQAAPPALPGNVSNAIGSIRAGDERAYELWSLLMGDERLRALLMPYLSSYNQAVDIAGYDRPRQSSGGSWINDVLDASQTALSIYGAYGGGVGG